MDFKTIEHRVDAMTQREKLILLAVVLVITLLLFMELLWSPHWQSQRQAEQQMQSAQVLQTALSSQQQTLQQAIAKDPNVALREENRQLEAQLSAKQDELRASLSRLVAPEEMPAMLIELLGNNPGLQVVLVDKLPTVKIQQGEGEGAAVLYSHRIRIVVEGRFFDALQYVQKIEAENGRLRLISLDYEVSRYPKAQLLLELETLGLDERWLGV